MNIRDLSRLICLRLPSATVRFIHGHTVLVEHNALEYRGILSAAHNPMNYIIEGKRVLVAFPEPLYKNGGETQDVRATREFLRLLSETTFEVDTPSNKHKRRKTALKKVTSSELHQYQRTLVI